MGARFSAFSANRCDWISIWCSETRWTMNIGHCVLCAEDTQYFFAYFTVGTKVYNVIIFHTVQLWLLFKSDFFLFEFYCCAVQYHCKVIDVFCEPPSIYLHGLILLGRLWFVYVLHFYSFALLFFCVLCFAFYILLLFRPIGNIITLLVINLSWAGGVMEFYSGSRYYITFTCISYGK